MNQINITKLDAARRQIDTSISLYFNDSDVVSVHTLICAAHEILKKIGEKQDIESFIIDKLVAMAYEDKQKELRDKFNEAKNYFKHLYPNPDKVLKFDPEFSEIWIWDACAMYEKICGETTDYMKVYKVWFYVKHDDMLVEGEHKGIAKEMKEYRKDKMDFFGSALRAFAKLK